MQPMAEEIRNENGDVLVPDTDRRTVHLRNDTGSEMKFPTIEVRSHAPGEVLPISLRRDEPIPFAFTPVNPDDHSQELEVGENGLEIAPSEANPTDSSGDQPKKARKSSSASVDAPVEGSPEEAVVSEEPTA